MRSPEVTKERILKQSGRLFNTQGYKATSLSDITSASGLTKGAIYKHFKNKEKLETETLGHLSQIMMGHMARLIKEQTTAPEKLRAIFHYHESYVMHPPLKGGCPLLNVAIECDDSNPALRKRAVLIMDSFRDAVVKILDNGVRYGQLKPGIDSQHYATLIIASLEGALMMSKLRGNNQDMVRVINHLDEVTKNLEV